MSVVLLLPLALTACGGGFDRAAALDSVRMQLTAGSGIGEAETACIMDFVGGLSDDELAMLDPDATATMELLDKLTAGMRVCAMAALP